LYVWNGRVRVLIGKEKIPSMSLTHPSFSLPPVSMVNQLRHCVDINTPT
jgi:hypothetical protein